MVTGNTTDHWVIAADNLKDAIKEVQKQLAVLEEESRRLGFYQTASIIDVAWGTLYRATMKVDERMEMSGNVK